MKLSEKNKKIIKIATISVLALLEIYLIYAAAASLHTFHQHPRFESADGEVAQSSGYRVQFFLCLAFAIVVPVASGVLSYFMFVRTPKAVAAVSHEAAREAASTDTYNGEFDEHLLPDIDGLSIDNLGDGDEKHLKPL